MDLSSVVGYAFLAMGTLIIANNWILAGRAVFLKESTSFVLLVGGFFATIGVLASPISNAFFWAPLTLDFTIALVIRAVLFSKQETSHNERMSSKKETRE